MLETIVLVKIKQIVFSISIDRDFIFQMKCVTTDVVYILTKFTVSSFMAEVIC